MSVHWRERWSSVVAMAVIVWALVYFPSTQVAYALQRGANLTELFDSYAEANGIRSGESYAERGFLFNYGLPDVSYGNSFENQGGKHDKNLCPTLPCIYLHYPPGPDLTIGVLTKMCGKGNLSCMRMGPISFTVLTLIFMAWALTRTIGVQRCAFVFGSFYFAPMVTNGMHNLYVHSGVTAFLFTDIGLLALAFFGDRKHERWILAGLFAIGFLYGWWAFDYAFHVALLPLAFWFLSTDRRATWPTLVRTTLVLCGSYAFANFTHLLQVRLFLGSWAATFDDFGARATMRMSGHLEVAAALPLSVLFAYWTRLLSEPQFLGYSFLALCAAAFTPLLARREVLVSRRWELAWAPRPFFKWAFLGAFIIPDVWLVLMRQHASVHGHFLPRNFVVTYVVGAIIVAMSFRRSAAAATEEAPRVAGADAA